jgi:MFS family permease
MARPTDTADKRAVANFGAFVASLFLSRMGDQILLFLVPLVVFRTTGDVAWSGWAFLAEALPRFLAFPVCGALCDRVSPLVLLRWSQWLRAAACIGGTLGATVAGGVGWLIALSALSGVLTTQGAIAREVILPRAFTAFRFEKVLAYSQLADQVGAVAGPAVAASMLVLWSWPVAALGAAGLFLLADLFLAYWRNTSTIPIGARDLARGVWVEPAKVALLHIVRTPVLRRLVIQAAGVNLVVGITLASSAALVTGAHAESATYYAGLQMAGALATVIVLMCIAHAHIPAPRLGLSAYAALIAGGLLTGLAAGSTAYAIGYLLVIGFDKMFNIYLRSTRQPVIPANDYGKTTGMMTLLNNLSQPLSGLALAALSAQLSAQGVVVLMTILMVLAGSLSMLARQATRSPRSA